MIELLEFIVVAYGVSIFAFDNLFSNMEYTHPSAKLTTIGPYMGMIFNVNKTSVLCIVVGLLNAMLPMDQINIMIFGEYTEKIDPSRFKHHEHLGRFTEVIFI